MDSGAIARPSRERDFLEELQRQRDEVADDGTFPTTPARNPMRGRGGRRGRGSAGRALGRRELRIQAAGDDLRRRRPGDPELPPPEVTRAGELPAVDR